MTEAVEVAAPEARPGVTVVTSENFDQYVNEQLPPKVETQAEDGQEAEPETTEEQTAEPAEGKKKGKLNERFSELTAARKAAEEKASKYEADLKAIREKYEAAEKAATELRTKYEPPKSDDLGPEPQPSQFNDIGEYAKALKDWTAESTRKADAQKASEERAAKEREQVAKTWMERQEAIKTELPDYEDKIAGSDVKVSEQMRDAIIESDVGPQLLYHLAEHPDLADTLSKMPVGKMLREMGKLEVALAKPAKAEQKQAEAKEAVAEISKAPPPINPLKGASQPVTNKVSANGEFLGTYEEYKRLRNSGKIK